MQINFIYDDSVANAPSGFKTGLAAAAGYLGTLITNQMTITSPSGGARTTASRFLPAFWRRVVPPRASGCLTKR
jgi:hypothetical protein